MGLSYYEDDSTSVEATTDDDVWDRDYDDDDDRPWPRFDRDVLVGAVCTVGIVSYIAALVFGSVV